MASPCCRVRQDSGCLLQQGLAVGQPGGEQAQDAGATRVGDDEPRRGTEPFDRPGDEGLCCGEQSGRVEQVKPSSSRLYPTMSAVPGWV
jgi:hypothetical protein